MEWNDEAVRAWQQEHPTLPLAGLVVLWRIDSVARAIEAFQQRVLASQGLAVSDYRALAALQPGGRADSQSPTQLAERLGHTSGGMTKILHRLESEGWIERRADPDDARSQRVVLTDRGQASFDRALRALAAATDLRLESLEARQRDALARALVPLARAFDAGEERS